MKRYGIWFGWFLAALLMAWAYQGAEINFAALIHNSGNMGQLARDFFPPDFTDGADYIKEMLVTIQIALWGTILALLAAIPFGLLASRNIAPLWVVQPVRRLMDCFRAINEMVFALLFVVAVGLGPFAGVMALFVHTTGVLAKLFSESVEAIEPGPVEGIRATGANVLERIRYGVIPQVLPSWNSLALYRFEANVRAASVLGIVGAGGIGQVLYENIRGFQYQQTCAIMIVVIVCVMLLDIASAQLRKLTS